MKTKYTPGPWLVEIDESDNAEWSMKWPRIVSKDHGEVVGTEGLYSEIERDKANACLISAAPELLEALEDITLHFLTMGKFDNDKTAQRMRAKAFTVINKAKGE